MCKLVGYKMLKNKKDGRPMCLAQILRDANPRDIRYGCHGQIVDDIWMPEEQVNLFTDADVGKEIKLEYEFSGGRAYLRSVSVCK